MIEKAVWKGEKECPSEVKNMFSVGMEEICSNGTSCGYHF